ncbi:MAG: hypothetical protein EOP56_16640 [Sphingobacteriales bacterium]|nr:MAG: hypothetical protein EOP56_16640 [Sphingobacteriales bacterium]
MKHFYSLFVLSVFLLTSCSKSPKNETTTTYDFVVNGVADVTVQQDSAAYLPLEIKHLSGTQEKVDLFVQGLPSNVTASIAPQNGTPTFASSIKFSAGYDATISSNAGVKVRAVSASGVAKEYNLTLDIVPATNCGIKLAGMYDATNILYTANGAYVSTRNYTTAVTLYNNNSETIQIVNFDGYTTLGQVYGGLDCFERRLTIPTQSFLKDRGYVITKAEYFGSNKIYIEYSGSGGATLSKVTFVKL